jgi:hypothetical protein
MGAGVTQPAIVIADWKPRQSNTLRGTFTTYLPSGLVLHEMTLHTRDGAWWIALPARPLLQDGAALHDEHGKVRYSAALVSFANRQARERFTGQMLAALRLAHPQVFAAERAPA